MEHLQFPVGRYQYKASLNDSERKQAIAVLKAFPQWLDIIIQNKDAIDFNKTYRPQGWTAAQVIHHCADSHMNCVMRLKLALTEDNPTIKPYLEDKWAEQIDYELPVNNSIVLLHAVHRKLVSLFENLSDADRQRTYYHPEAQQSFTLDALLDLYAWHCQHHFGHLKICFGEGVKVF
jgi:hypothetical protein